MLLLQLHWWAGQGWRRGYSTLKKGDCALDGAHFVDPERGVTMRVFVQRRLLR